MPRRRFQSAGARKGRQIVVLVKPQFEAGREHVGKGGIVRDPEAHRLAIERVRTCAGSLSAIDLEVIDSPIHGAEGNAEFLLHARWGSAGPKKANG